MKDSNTKVITPGGILAILMVATLWTVSVSTSQAGSNRGDDLPATNANLIFDGQSPYMVPAAAFASDGFLPDSLFFPFGGGYFQGNSKGYGCMVAPVNLPNGAIINDMFASVYDNDAGRNMTVNLERVDNFSGGTDTMATVATKITAASTAIRILHDGTIKRSQIVYPDYSYYLTTCLHSADLRLYSVRLHLEFFSYLPFIKK